MDIFLIIILIITILFWIDLFLPDPIPVIDELLLFLMMIFGWVLYGFWKVTTEGIKIVSLIFSPIGIIVITVIAIGFAIWKFDLLGDIPTKKRRRK